MPPSAEAVSACKRRDLSSNRLFDRTRIDIIRANLYQPGGKVRRDNCNKILSPTRDFIVKTLTILLLMATVGAAPISTAPLPGLALHGKAHYPAKYAARRHRQWRAIADGSRRSTPGLCGRPRFLPTYVYRANRRISNMVCPQRLWGQPAGQRRRHGCTNATTPNRNPVADQRTIERIIATANEVEAPRVLRGGQRQDCDNLIRVANRSQRQQDWDGSAIRFRTVAPAK